MALMDIEQADLARATSEAEAEAEAEAEQRSTGRLRRWQDVLIIGPIVLNTIYYYAGLPLNALLIGTHPVLLEFVRGSTLSVVAAGGFARVGKAFLPAVVLAPVLISMWTDPCYFYAGRRYGRRIIEFYERNDPRWRKRIARGERFFRRFGLWTIVVAPFLPGGAVLLYIAAGEAGMPFVLFILADLLGNLLFIGMLVALGWIVGKPAVDVAQTISHYALWSIIATFAVVIVYSIWSSWSNSRQQAE